MIRVAFAALLLTSLLAGCAREPDEQALRRTLAEMEAAVETGHPADFLAGISADFAGQDGAVDRDQLRALLLGYRLRYRDIGLALGPATVQLFKDRATVSVEVLASAGQGLPETGQVITIESHWRREDGDWHCFAANWDGRF